MRWLVLALASVLLGCEAERRAVIAPPHPQATLQPVHLITAQAPGKAGSLFGTERERNLVYGRVDVAVPPERRLGQIDWPRVGRPVDTSRHFTLTGSERFETFDGLAQELLGTETLVFVHGYNTSAGEAAYQVAQMRQDFELDMPTIAYAWPSARDVRGYLYDRDSVLFSRAGFSEVLGQLAQHKQDILLIAHSMGSLLVMETLRDLALTGDRRTLSRISGVVLISPDLDPQVFRRQVVRIGDDLPLPFLIFSVQEDRALQLSSFFTGGRARLGTVRSPEDVEGLPVAVVDLSAFAQDRGLNHNTALRSPEAIRLISRLTGEGDVDAQILAPYLITDGRPAF